MGQRQHQGEAGHGPDLFAVKAATTGYGRV